jgi:RNA polymerase sigma factor (sigma-70 family)
MAAKKFNPEHKVKFLTYANYWIFKYIVNFLKFENKIIPTDLEKYSKDNLNEEPWTEVESTIEANILKEKATKIMVNKNITLRDIDIIMNRYLTPDPETLQTLGDKYNISRERVRQIESKWTNIIKKKLNL